MTKKHKNQIKKQIGQGLVEYALILVLVSVVIITVLSLLGPAVGEVFSNIVGQIEEPDEQETINESVSLTLIGGIVYPYPTEIEMGTIEIYGIPNEVRVDNDILVRAIIIPNEPIVKISLKQTPTLDGWQLPPLSDNIEIYPKMSATLLGSGFNIEPEGRLEKQTDVGMPAEWVWTVSPIEPGDEVVLNLEISVPVEVLNSTENIEKSFVAIANYPFTIRVLGKTGLTSFTETAAEWIVRLLGLGIVLGIINGIYSFGKFIFKRIRKKRALQREPGSDTEVEIVINEKEESESNLDESTNDKNISEAS